MDDIDSLFANNRAWARRMVEDDPAFFSRLAEQQAPRYLWIGCSDSRVPANQIIGLAPGEIFVHRNVANLVVFTDLNCLSVLQYAIDVLKVEHVMVVGHYGCGGIQAVLERRKVGLADAWLQHVEDLMHTHARRLDAIEDPHERSDRLCEINVIEQVGHVSRLPIVEEAWNRGQKLVLHGMIYGIHDGLLRELCPAVDRPVEPGEWRRATLRALWDRPGGRSSRLQRRARPAAGAAGSAAAPSPAGSRRSPEAAPASAVPAPHSAVPAPHCADPRCGEPPYAGEPWPPAPRETP
jgi:carbonic anhydrase